ncbi:DGQHR domain-containing protein [Arthrobacter sp. 2YAF22_2]
MKIQAITVPGRQAVATLTPDLLKELAFISTYETKDPLSSSPQQHGYQREPMEARFSSIGKYYNEDDKRFLIPPIIASARVYKPEDIEKFNALFNAGDIAGIKAAFTKSAFSIVDGQHRLGGLHYAWTHFDNFEADVPVMIYYGLGYAEEAHLFDDINSNQRKLPKALIETTNQHMMKAGPKDHAQVVREIAFAAAQDGDSVWKEKINMTGARDPERSVTYEGLRRSTSQMFPELLIKRLVSVRLNPEDTAKKYWEMVSKACHDAWVEKPRYVLDEEGNQVEEKVHYRLKDLVGVASLAKLGKDIISTSLDKAGSNVDLFFDSLADMTSKLGAVDWEKGDHNPWMRGQAGFAGQKELYETLYNLVYLDQQPGEAAGH